MAANSGDKCFSAFYIAGKDWYSALGFVYDYGGQIATSSDGKWTGTLDQPRAIAGLNAWKNTYLALSRASKTTDEANPFPTVPFSQGHAASFIGPGWQFGYALDPKAGNPKLKPFMGAFPMPSHTPGKTMPAFIGGSDLAIPAASGNKDLAVDWIADFTATPQMKAHRHDGEPPEHDVAPQPRQGHAGLAAREVGEGHLVRPDREELDERRERERAPAHALEHPHQQGRPSSRPRSRRATASPASSTRTPNAQPGTQDAMSSDPVPASHRCRRIRLRADPAASPSHPQGARPGGGALRADRAGADRDRRDPRLPGLLPRPALVRAVRPHRS